MHRLPDHLVQSARSLLHGWFMLLVVLVLFSIAIIIVCVVGIDFEDLELFLELLLSWIFLS